MQFGLYQRGSLINQIVNALVEMTEALVLRLAAMKTNVDLLQNDSEFENGEDFVIADERHIAAGLFGISADQFAASKPARLSGDRGLGTARIAGLRPIAQDQAEIDQRVAYRRHFPVEHRFDAARILQVEHHVIELEIVVNQRGRRRCGQPVGEPLDDAVHQRDFFGLSAVPALEPAADLALQKALRLAERHQAVLNDIDGVQRDQAIDKAAAYAPRVIGEDG